MSIRTRAVKIEAERLDRNTKRRAARAKRKKADKQAEKDFKEHCNAPVPEIAAKARPVTPVRAQLPITPLKTFEQLNHWDVRQSNPGLHLLYVKWAVKHLTMLDRMLHELGSCSNINMNDAFRALFNQRRYLVENNPAYGDAHEMLFDADNADNSVKGKCVLKYRVPDYRQYDVETGEIVE